MPILSNSRPSEDSRLIYLVFAPSPRTHAVNRKRGTEVRLDARRPEKIFDFLAKHPAYRLKRAHYHDHSVLRLWGMKNSDVEQWLRTNLPRYKFPSPPH